MLIVVQKNSSREGKFTFYGWDYNFSLSEFMTSKRKLYGQNIFDCRKTSKKNARYYSRDYSIKHVWLPKLF